MDWPADIQPYRCDFYLQNRTTAFRSPLTGSRQVLARQGARWVATVSFRFVGLRTEHRRLAQRVDALLAKMKGQLETVNVWDFARPSPLGPALDRTSIADTHFSDSHDFTDSTAFDGGTAGLTVYGTFAVGAEAVVVDGFPGGTSQIYGGDYIELAGFLYMLTEDAEADAFGRATLQLNRGLVAAVPHATVPVLERPATPMQLVDDDQANRSVGVGQVYEFTVSLVESFF